jgi:hypothetical protein
LPPPVAPPSQSGVSRPSRRQGPGLVLPILLIGGGLIALLVNFGLVSADQLLRLFNLWPVAVILLGVVLIFRVWLPRFALAVAIALAAVLVVGAVAYSALPPGLQVATAQGDYSAPLTGVEKGQMRIELGASNLTVQGADIPDLYRAHIEYPSGRPPKVNAEHGTVSIEGNRGFTLLGVRGSNRDRVSLNQSVPWDLEVGGGASRQTLDLSAMHLSSLNVSGGANQAEVRLPRPSGTVLVHISGGASNITVHRPSGVAARVQMSGGASNLTADGSKHSVLGGDVNWQTSDYDGAADRYDLQVSGGASNVTVDQG